jgi:hypothetical protein
MQPPSTGLLQRSAMNNSLYFKGKSYRIPGESVTPDEGCMLNLFRIRTAKWQ